MGRHYKGRSIIQDEIRMELCVKGVRQMQANSASDWVSETKPQQNTFIRQINNFPYPKFVRILSEGIVAFESANTTLPVLWVKQLCASRPAAILEYFIIPRQLLQLEIASRSLEKQMCHTVRNTQAQIKEKCRLDSFFPNDNLHYVCRQHYIPFHVYVAAAGYG